MLPANPTSITNSRWKQEVSKIRKVLENANKNAEEYEFQDRAHINWSELSQELTALTPSIIHISGCEDGIAGLVFENPSQSTNVSNQNRFIAEFFKAHSQFINCIVFSGFCSEDQIREIAQYIEFLVGIPSELEEASAIQFLDEFYFQLASNRGIEISYDLAIKRLQQKEDYINKALFPKLFSQKDEVNYRDWENELEICIKDLGENPGDVVSWKRKASLLKDLGRIDEMNEAYERIAILEPDNYKNRVKQGDDLEELGDHKKADNAYTKAIELEEKDYKVWWKRARALTKDEQYEAAIVCYEKALALDPSSPYHYVIFTEYGFVLDKIERYCESVQAYRTSLQLQSNHRLANYQKKKVYKKIYSKKS
jgi:tetratricopeptide (TPR) repeat protein